MGSSEPDYGRRLLPVLVDEISRDDPERPFVSLSRSSSPEDGFKDVTYRSFANAINKAAWWLEAKLGKSRNFEVLAYTGPSDIRYPIIVYAAVKVGYKVSLGNLNSSLSRLIDHHLSTLRIGSSHIDSQQC